jgi:iron complex transport system substrate-binding protein
MQGEQKSKGLVGALSRRDFIKMTGIAGLSLLSANALGGCAGSSTASSSAAANGASRTFVDSAGREVTLTGQPQHIAALRGNSYERSLFYGRSKQVAVCMEPQKWAHYIFPDFNPDSIDDATNPNIEDLGNKGIDLTFFWNTPDVIDSLTAVGIPVVVGTDETDRDISSTSEFMDWMKSDIQLFGNVFGEEADKSKANEWCDYADKVYSLVTERTSKLQSSQIPSVYYVRGPKVTATHAKKSITIWYVRMAGGKLVSEDIDQKIANVDVEQINAWNPDVIFMGRLKSTDDIVKSPDFQNINAVKNNKVYVNPCGVYEWDYGSEGVLFVQWLAKKLHPDMFEDINMEEEVKKYYTKFFDYNLNDDEVYRILNNMDPQ